VALRRGTPTSSLEVFVLWDGVGNTVGVEEHAHGTDFSRRLVAQAALAARKAAPESGARASRFVTEFLNTCIVDLSRGIGPYTYLYHPRRKKPKASGVLTLYGSYQLYDAIRAVAFDARR